MKLISSANFYHFNPTCEYAVNNGTDSWQPNKILQKMENDLEVLPAFLAQPSDIILLQNTPSKAFTDRLALLNINLPKSIYKNELQDFSKYQIGINSLNPWGWSPVEHKLLKPLKTYCSDDFKKSPVFNWKTEHRDLYSKKFALQLLNIILANSDHHRIIHKEQVGRICTTRCEIEKLLSKWGKLMIKAPWSSSGRGLQPISKTPVHEKVWEKILGIVNDQGYVVVEPLLNKIFDLAIQFNINRGKVNFLGISKFLTDKKGQYQGNFLNQSFTPEIESTIQYIKNNICKILISVIEGSDLATYYEGNFGIDMLIFLDKQQNIKINPCLEINVRQNMGLLSLQFEKMIAKNSPGLFRTYYNPKKSFYNFVKEMEMNHPLNIIDQKIKSGFYPLTDYNKQTMFGAYILVE